MIKRNEITAITRYDTSYGLTHDKAEDAQHTQNIDDLAHWLDVGALSVSSTGDQATCTAKHIMDNMHAVIDFLQATTRDTVKTSVAKAFDTGLKNYTLELQGYTPAKCVDVVNDGFKVGDSVRVYDRYRFASRPEVIGHIVDFSKHNDGVEVKLLEGLNPAVHKEIKTNVTTWFSIKQLRHYATGGIVKAPVGKRHIPGEANIEHVMPIIKAVPPVLAWQHIPDEYKYVTMDNNGMWYGWTTTPITGIDGKWYSKNPGIGKRLFVTIIASPDNYPVAEWRKTLIERPVK